MTYDGAEPHILVVDDDDGIRDLVTRYLNENGFLSLSVACAEDALEAIEFGEFDALVVDVMMPKVTGIDFTKVLRKKNDIPVLLLTALGETNGGRFTGAAPFILLLSRCQYTPI